MGRQPRHQALVNRAGRAGQRRDGGRRRPATAAPPPARHVRAGIAAPARRDRHQSAAIAARHERRPAISQRPTAALQCQGEQRTPAAGGRRRWTDSAATAAAAAGVTVTGRYVSHGERPPRLGGQRGPVDPARPHGAEMIPRSRPISRDDPAEPADLPTGAVRPSPMAGNWLAASCGPCQRLTATPGFREPGRFDAVYKYSVPAEAMRQLFVPCISDLR